MNPANNQHIGIQSKLGDVWDGTLNNVDQLIPTDITAKSLTISIQDPGAGGTRTFAVQKDGVDTTQLLTFSNGETQKTITADVDFMPQDLVVLEHRSTGTPNAITQMEWEWAVQPDTDSECIYLGGSQDVPVNNASEYNYVVRSGGADNYISTEASRRVVFPTAGTISKLHVNISNSPGTGDQYDFNIRKNLSATGQLNVNIADSATEGDSGLDTMSIVAGDVVVFEVDPTNSPSLTRVRTGFVFVPTVPEEQVILTSTDNPLIDSGTAEYNTFGDGKPTAWSTVEADHDIKIFNPMTLSKLYVLLNAAPGGVTTRTFTVRKNAASTGVTVQFTGAEDSKGDTVNTEDLVADDRINIILQNVGSVVSSYAMWGIVLMEPASGLPTRSFVPGMLS